MSEPELAASLFSEDVAVPFRGGSETFCEVEEVKVLASLPVPSLGSMSEVILSSFSTVVMSTVLSDALTVEPTFVILLGSPSLPSFGERTLAKAWG